MVDQHPRIDDLRQLTHPVKRRVDISRNLLQEGVDSRRIPPAELARELQVHSERDEILLDPVVQGALDPPAVGVGGSDQARRRGVPRARGHGCLSAAR